MLYSAYLNEHIKHSKSEPIKYSNTTNHYSSCASEEGIIIKQIIFKYLVNEFIQAIGG